MLTETLIWAITWLTTTADSNHAFALICLIGLLGAGARFCLVLTLVVHVAMML